MQENMDRELLEAEQSMGQWQGQLLWEELQGLQG